MPELTPAQLRLLDTALAQGLLSDDSYREARQWNAGLAHKREESTPERSKSTGQSRSHDVRAQNLRIQILLREIEIEKQRGDGRQLKILKRRLKSLEQLNFTLTPPEETEKKPEEDSQGERTLPEAALEAIGCLEQLHKLSENLQTVAVLEHVRADSILGDTDAAICLCWNNFPPSSLTENLGSSWDLLTSLGSYRECQLLSARCAEQVMQTYYSCLGMPVLDVSSQQLDGTSEDWKAFDLRVGNRLIDVKNARQSLNGNGGYVEHCVPKFKEYRGYGEHVVIAGVLSPYHKENTIYRHDHPTATVLGEVNVVEVRSLYRWAKKRFGTRLDLKGIWNPGFLPGWIFEYPKEHYPMRSVTIDSISDLLRRLSDSGMKPTHLPGWMLLLCRDDSLVSSLALDEHKGQLVSDLRKMSSTIGFSRRSLYVYAMGLALDALADGKSPDKDLKEFLTLVEMPINRLSDNTLLGHKINDKRSSLLGLIDPQGYVITLVENLTLIGRYVHESGIHLTGFRLSHPAILKGICADGKTLTLMAFCGGWQTFPFRARCGTTPLTLGSNKHCPSCGHLVCHKCGHCSNACSECDPRQHEVARVAMEEASEFRSYDYPWDEINDF